MPACFACQFLELLSCFYGATTLCSLSMASSEMVIILQLRSCLFLRLMSSGITQVSLYTAYFSSHCTFDYRADYNPDQYLWEKNFTLAGRAYRRQDLEASMDGQILP